MIKYLKRFVFDRLGHMVKEIFSRIIEAIEEKVIDKEIDLDKNNFIEIKKEQFGNKIAFIDGGQAELLKAVNFSLQFIRTTALIFKDNRKVDSSLNEFFVLAYADNNEYKTEIFQLKGDAIDNMSIDSLDSSIREGNERASVSKIGNIVRRFAELKLAKQMIEKLEKEDIVVLDGSLKCMVKGEDNYMQELFQKAEESGIIVASLAKTSKILAENGSCIASQLSKLADSKNEWYYYLNDEGNLSISMVKLNKSSNHVFEFNIFNKQKELAESVLGLLANNSNDAVFPGYPYGLMQADKFARVSNQERDYLLTSFKANAGKRWNKLKQSVNVLNAHEILDTIS